MKNRIAGIKAKIGRGAANVLKMSKKEKSRIQKFLAFDILIQSIMPTVYASGLSEETVKSYLSGPIGIVTGAVSSLGALMVLVSIAQYMLSDDPQTGARAKQRIKIILIAWFAILCTTIILGIIVSLANVGINSLYNGTI